MDDAEVFGDDAQIRVHQEGRRHPNRCLPLPQHLELQGQLGWLPHIILISQGHFPPSS